MRSERKILVFLFFLPIVSFFIKESYGQEKLRFGVVDFQAVVSSIPEGRKAVALIEKKINTQRPLIEKQAQELRDIQNNANEMSEEEQSELGKEWQAKLAYLRKLEMELKSEIREIEQGVLNNVKDDLVQFVEEVAEELSLVMVFDKSSSGLVYFDNAYVQDITDDVIAKF